MVQEVVVTVAVTGYVVTLCTVVVDVAMYEVYVMLVIMFG